MSAIANIAYKAVGITGLSCALYDASVRAKTTSKIYSDSITGDYLEKVHFSTRGLNENSAINNAMQQKVRDWRMNNPIVPAYGKVVGTFKGFFNSIGDKLIPISFASLAIATKGLPSKIGAFGVIGTAIYNIAVEGFGVGKSTSMD